MSDDVQEPIEEIEAPVDPWEGEDADAIRAERNQRLSDSDFLVLPDSPAQRDMQSRAAIWLYRKALRDVTANFASPEDVVWPELPEL
jgi:hypothetical protein